MLRLLFAARLCLGPGSYHGARGALELRLELHRPQVPSAPAVRSPGPCMRCRPGPALRLALPPPECPARRRRPRRSPCGSRVVVQSGSRTRRAGTGRRSDPWGSVPASARSPGRPRPRPAPPAPEFPGSPRPSASARLDARSQRWQVTSLRDTRGHPRGSSGGSCQPRAPGAVSSSHSPLWRGTPTLGTPPAVTRLSDTPDQGLAHSCPSALRAWASVPLRESQRKTAGGRERPGPRHYQSEPRRETGAHKDRWNRAPPSRSFQLMGG